MKTDIFQSCGHCWVFQICWHIECSIYRASSFRIWNSLIISALLAEKQHAIYCFYQDRSSPARGTEQVKKQGMESLLMDLQETNWDNHASHWRKAVRVWRITYALPRCLNGKESTCQCRRHRLHPWAGKFLWRRKLKPTPVFFPRKSHEQRNLAGPNPQGRKRVRHSLETNQ